MQILDMRENLYYHNDIKVISHFGGTMENQENKLTLDHSVDEKSAHEKSGWLMLFVVLGMVVIGIAVIVAGIARGVDEGNDILALLIPVGIIILVFAFIISIGFKLLQPNEAYVLTLFGKYYGTLKRDGFFWVNPFCVAVNPARGMMGVTRKLSLKAMTLNNDKQKVNDEEGNPIEITVVVIWRIANTARAVFNVDNYMAYLSTQCDAAIRQVARQYPYDVSSSGDEKSLRGSAQEIANVLKKELQMRSDMAGIEVLEARISHLAYAPEIAAAMLQRQQASAIIAARQKIVEGAVSMVQMALNKLSEEEIVELDDERKAQMVSNLLVVLCGNRDAQPVVGTGSIY